MSDRPLILVSNDDGIDAKGIRALAAAVSDLGDVVVVAPLEEQSAVGHAITMRTPVRLRSWPFAVADGSGPDIRAFAVTGTPADCVKIAVDKLLDRRPDLVVSGVNHGANTAVNVLYSGTVSAATEGSVLGIPSIAFSLCANGPDLDFRDSTAVARQISRKVLSVGLAPGILLNVNIPAVARGQLQGAMVTRQARARWEEEFVERRDPFDELYYWLSGRFVELDNGANTDLWAISNGFVSITPIDHDLTAHEQLERLDGLRWLDA